ncbi:hypothetical protein JB92DRAFT_512133 [Gautieria morchelliformis]|nr:hypothetical protein JB92DRAFT_512133 [Gautieria morchelliformis]
MLFDALRNVANTAIQHLFGGRPAHPPTSSELNLGKSPLLLAKTPSLSRTTGVSSKALVTSFPEIYSPNHDDPVDIDEVNKTDVERHRLPSLGGHSQTNREANAFQHTELDDGLLYNPVPLCHPRPSLGNCSPDLCPFIDTFYSTQSNQDTSPPSPGSENGYSPTPSMVPTLVSPPPSPHSCVGQARALGILVRDFAYENHGVTLAQPVPNIDGAKDIYYSYLTMGFTPSLEVIDTLKAHDPQWVTDTERQIQKLSSQPESKSGISDLPPWRPPRRRPSRGLEQPVPCSEIPAEDDSCLASEITPCLDAISLTDDAPGEEVIHDDA